MIFLKTTRKSLYLWLGIAGIVLLACPVLAECPNQVLVHVEVQVLDTDAETHRLFRKVTDAFPVVTASENKKITEGLSFQELPRWSKKQQAFNGPPAIAHDTAFYTLTSHTSRAIRGIDILLAIHCLII